MDGTKDGRLDGSDEGEVLGIDEGSADRVAVGLLVGEELGKDVEGEALGNAVTSRSRQTSLRSQQTLQHLQTTSAGLSPPSSARQSEESFSIIDAAEQSSFGTAPDSRFFSIDSFSKLERKPSCSGIPPIKLFICKDRLTILESFPTSDGMLPDILFPDRSRVRREVRRPISDGIGPVSEGCDNASSKVRRKGPPLVERRRPASPVDEISMISKLVRKPISVGIIPVIALSDRFSDVREVRSPISRGRVPTRFCDCSDREVMVSSPMHPIPSQSQ